MGRNKVAAPAYSKHVSGQAVVRLDGRDFYLGKHGTPESYAKYLALIEAYQANGLRAPDEYDRYAELTISQAMVDFKASGIKRLTPSGNRTKHYERLAEVWPDRPEQRYRAELASTRSMRPPGTIANLVP